VHEAGIQDCRGAKLLLSELNDLFPVIELIWGGGAYQCLRDWFKEGPDWRHEIMNHW
jgi:hypothetical protein